MVISKILCFGRLWSPFLFGKCINIIHFCLQKITFKIKMNMIKIDLNTPVWQLTAGDFLDLLERGSKPVTVIDTTKDDRHFVYGLAGIAELFGCSKTTANRLKQSGKIDKAIYQIGNKIIVDADKALKLIAYSKTSNSKRL
jgi:hypothetical protein